jgi:chromate transporter
LASALPEIAAVFLKLGVVAVGGPAAHVALMRREVVQRRHWLDETTFFDDFAACQLIPGPSSTELAILLGYRRAGAAGLLVAGLCFILPATLLMLGLAWVYTRFASSSLIAGALHGIRPVVIAVMAWALIDLGRRIVRGPVVALVGLAVMAAGLLGMDPVILLLGGGLLLLLRQSGRSRFTQRRPLVWLAASSGLGSTTLLGLFLVFLKFGAVSFGSGYILFAFLHADVVQGYHWLSDRQLVDAIAISQATPGPLFTVATFIGFIVAGTAGAVVATVGIFLPGFVLVPFLERIVRLVNRHQWARAFLEGVNVAALGLIAVVAIQLGRTSLVDPLSVVIAGVAFAILVRFPLAAPALVIAAGSVGVIAGR